MKRIASILTGLSLAVLFFGASAHAQSERRMFGNIPFDFTVGALSLPAGQYEFRAVGNDIIQIQDSDGRSLLTLSSAPVEANRLPEKSTLKFAVVDGHHVLIQSGTILLVMATNSRTEMLPWKRPGSGLSGEPSQTAANSTQLNTNSTIRRGDKSNEYIAGSNLY
jgi:hypothetical protein